MKHRQHGAGPPGHVAVQNNVKSDVKRFLHSKGSLNHRCFSTRQAPRHRQLGSHRPTDLLSPSPPLPHAHTSNHIQHTTRDRAEREKRIDGMGALGYSCSCTNYYGARRRPAGETE
ncbi:hypothetical protein BRADI_1g66875v3 [Brachypodium distachyon]|uniref:Uncharacterized protein n=1 Tax=Brachypodium distachyon TaxID=15368 RepID=A0A0Q3HHH0_BRADI|nr:hypothetical protein BRADI_1g66875v3 [Brachypodium distachyon]